MRTYFKEIDIIKGITILLVILGHSFCTFPLNLYDEFPVFGTIVRSFQMPLFFVASGFLFSTRGGWASLIKKKSVRLLVPYLVFGILSILLRFVFGAIIRGGTTGLPILLLKLLNGEFYWFLYTLLLVMFIVQLINSYKLLYITALTCIILCIFTDIRLLNVMTLGKIIYYLPFFIFGMVIKKRYSQIMMIFEQYRQILCITLTLLYAIAIYIDLKFCINVFSLYIIPVTGILMVWGFSKIMTNYSHRFVDFFAHFGKYSLQYYLNHMLILLPFYYMVSYISNCPPILPLITIFAGTVTTSYIMLRIELCSKALRAICGLK